jgi:cytochrome d ubiquinol oxidase subunit II
MTLVQFWFIVIALLWTGFFVLEGFDFGVGMLHAGVGRDEAGRRAAVNTIGPLWDGNEVWLVVAGAAMFAAFPDWYATMFSGFYLVLVILLLALIVRGVSFEYRGKSDSPRWRRSWDVLMMAGSLVAPLLIGVALGDLLHGLPIDKAGEYTGNFVTLLQPYALYTGVTLVVLCLLHGATFLALKTTGEVRDRAGRTARRVAPPAALLTAGFAIWTHVTGGKGVLPNPVEVLAILAVLAAAWLVSARREGWAFAATTFAMATAILSMFTELYPRVMVSSTSPAYSLTISNAASGSYALKVMTVVVVIFLPLVLLYQAWTYYVFRQRLSAGDFRPPALLTRQGNGRPPGAGKTGPSGPAARPGPAGPEGPG